MGSVNNCMIVGRLGADPDVHEFDGGDKVVNLSVATDAEWTDRSGERQSETTWHRVVVRGNQAEPCARFLAKGREVAVTGEYRSRKYTDKDGNERVAFELRARQVTFLGAKQDGAAPTVAAPAAQESADVPF